MTFIVLRLREFFERTFGSSSDYEYNNNNIRATKSRSLDENFLPSNHLSSPRVTLYSRPSFFKTLTFAVPKCAHCKRAKREAKRLKFLQEKQSITESQAIGGDKSHDENGQTNDADNSDVDSDNGISTQPNLKVNEAVVLFEKQILQTKKDIPRGSAFQVFPYANFREQSLVPSSSFNVTTQTPEDQRGSKLLLLRNRKSFDEALFLNTIPQNSTEDDVSPPTVEFSRVVADSQLPSFSLSLTTNHAPEFISLRTKMQRESTACNEDRYQSLLMEGVPFYQDYNQNAIKRDSFLAQAPFTNASGVTHQSRRATALGTLSRTLIDRHYLDTSRRGPSPVLRSHSRDPSIPRSTHSHSIIEEIENSETDSPPLSPRSFQVTLDLEETIVSGNDIASGSKSPSVLVDGEDEHLHTQDILLRDFVSGPGGLRWIEMTQVQNSDKLSQLSPFEIKRQEALFEIITSEASYFRSLTVLIEDYMKSVPFDCNLHLTRILHPLDKHMLFSNILEIYETSARFLGELEHCWLQSPIIDDLCHIVRDFAHSHFKCFITYIKNQHYQNSKYVELSQRKYFRDSVARLQKVSQCPGLPLDTFLLLPMQRITRLQLLVKAVLQKTEVNTEHYRSALMALGALEKILMECESAKSQMHHKQRIVEWSNCLSFSAHVKMVSLSEHKILKLGEVDFVHVGANGPTALRRFIMAVRPIVATIILMNDYVLFAKKRKSNPNGVSASTALIQNSLSPNEMKYSVEDGCEISKVICHCASHILLSPSDQVELLKRQVSEEFDETELIDDCLEGPFMLHLILHANEPNQCDYRVQVADYLTMERWLDAFNLAKDQDLGKTFEDYVRENYPQAVVTRSFLGKEDDHLDLKDGEIIVLLRRVGTSWCKGITRDNRQGWFPSKHVTLILNEDMKTRSTDMAAATEAYMEWCRSLDEASSAQCSHTAPPLPV